MNKQPSSTKVNPIKYIQYFLKEEVFIKHENDFYSLNVNPSFEAHRKEGYIYYFKDNYINDELPYVKLYFIKELEKKLIFQINISIALAKERKDEIENTSVNANIYINKQLKKIALLRDSINYSDKYKSIILKYIDRFEREFSILLEQGTKVPQKTKPSIRMGSRTFFDLKIRYVQICVFLLMAFYLS